MDSFIYALVLQPALRELLPRSGLPADTGTIGYYNGLLLALFLMGWGLSMLWGPIGDRFGRVRTLIFTILCYSVFTFAGALAPEHLATGHLPIARGHRHRRRMDSGRNFRRRGMAGASPQDGRGLHADRLLRRNPHGRAAQRDCRRSLRVARDVRHRRLARVPGGADPIRRARTGALEAARVRAPRHGHAVLAPLPPPHHCSTRSTSSFRSADCGPGRRMFLPRSHFSAARQGLLAHRNHAPVVLRHHSPFRRHHPRMPRAAASGGAIRPPAGPWRSTSS